MNVQLHYPHKRKERWGWREGMQSAISLRQSVSVWVVCVLYCVLALHACYVTMSSPDSFSDRGLSVPSVRASSGYVYERVSEDDDESGMKRGWAELVWNETVVNGSGLQQWPELFIFRRTKKTGSSSMMNALMDALQPLGYYAPPHMEPELEGAIRNEFRRKHPRRTMVLHHNSLTRNVHPARRAVIADTIRDGYKHVTSYCRYIKHVKTCNGSDMEECLRSSSTLRQNRYRWAFRPREDLDTYIDLPLSSAHPALSTTVLRTVFPNVTLHVHHYNVRDLACSDDSPMRVVYDQLYLDLELQVEKLRRRLLVVAGYPYVVDPKVRENVTLVDMIDAAERLERLKYQSEHDFDSEQRTIFKTKGKSEQVIDHLSSRLMWHRNRNRTLTLIKERTYR